MSFLRKASLSRKKQSDDPVSPRGIRGDKPPRTRAVSQPGLAAENGENGQPKRKVSISQKGRKRLSSLFSSSSLSSFDKEPSASPSITRSNLNPSTTSSSTASTPTRELPPSVSQKYATLNGKGVPPLEDGVRGLAIATDSGPLSDSPQDSPAKPTTSSDRVTPAVRPQRTASLYSQWDEEDNDDESDNDEAFLTPSEGLSEVEEEEEPPENGTPQHATNGDLDKTNVDKGAVATGGDVSGTGKSTIQRTLPTSSETKVRRREASKAHALSIDQAAILAQDIDTCREILMLFLTSRMKEAEDLCFEKDPDGNRLYLQSAHGIIQALKGMMTFDSHDLANALEICKNLSVTASALRKPSDSIVSRLGGLVRTGAGVQRVKAMTVLERHAELVYAETSLMKAMLAIVSGGDWLGLVKEALNMRTAHGIYRTLQQYLDDADRNGFDEDIDMDFRSGVLLGTGTSSLMLSLLPGKVLKIAEVFGYTGDRKVALATLMSAGGWSESSEEPAYNERNEGLRRPVCDMILLSFHLVISILMPVDDVDIKSARKILAYNMKRYPNGVFFLYFQARLHTAQCEPELANQSLQNALDLKLEYIQLQHMCLWDFAGNNLMLGNFKSALDSYSILKDESNWSRAVYTYSAASCIIELVDDGDESASLDEADKLMKMIPKLTKKIAGKSLPIEKLCNRKARKFESQGHRLFLPALELSYVFGALSHTPRRALLGIILPRIDRALDKLQKTTPEEYGLRKGTEYWDDYCLGHFLRGVVQFVARYQPPEAAESAKVPGPGEPSDDEIDHGAEADFQAVLRHGPQVQLDHYILYHCHYELGRLYARRGDVKQARVNFDAVMSGKLLEVNPHEKKASGKYSLEGALLLKTHAALQGLKNGEAV
ncbi:hypothetical protein BCR39DRAFT_518906 [Naematelia encephala]|uniref:Uncharacterized protein n=1 Tax=Naematelia encephala TaxID=71784 RepID=A0A1Y2BFY4_9TREE|nr:hypothetical protein BCR39DRAFT_518906 [Naematelia encephala]